MARELPSQPLAEQPESLGRGTQPGGVQEALAHLWRSANGDIAAITLSFATRVSRSVLSSA